MSAQPSTTTAVIGWITNEPPNVRYAIAAGAVLTLLCFWRVLHKLRETGRDKVISGLVNVAALLATSVQASGMWKFFGTTMALPVGFRIFMFSFMEIALLACGLRARSNVEGGGDAGIDGVLVWAFAIGSGLMSATDAATPREGLMRIMVSVVVALLWTRDLMAAKKAKADQVPGKKRTGPVRWRVTPERIAVVLRLADAIDTDVTTVESARQVARFLRVTDRERDGWQWPMTAKARAYRGRMRLISDALRHGDPTEVHQKLSAAAFADALNRLGVIATAGPDGDGPDQTGQPAPAGPDRPDAQTGQADRSTETPRPIRPVTPRPDRPKPDRSARPVKPSGPSGPTGQGKRAPLEDLETVCRTWAVANDVDPAHMSRSEVLEVVRSAGYSCSTDRAASVQALLDPKGATSEMERGLTGPGGAR